MNAQDTEQLTRHLIAKGRRIAIGGTVIPHGWVPDEATMRKIRPQDPELEHQVRALMHDGAMGYWKDYLKNRI